MLAAILNTRYSMYNFVGGTNGWLQAVVKDTGHVPDWEHLLLLSSRKYGMIPTGNTNWNQVMYDMKQLGAFVAKERKRQGVTQLQLSQATDVGRRFIVELEGGKETIHAGKLLKVLDTLGIDLTLTAPEGT